MSYLWIGGSVLGIIVFIYGFARFRKRMKRRVRKGSVLELDLRQGIAEQSQKSPLSKLTSPRSSLLRDLVFGLERAAKDKRVSALIVESGSSLGLGLAQMQELRQAVIRFRELGKKAYFYAESVGTEASGLATWYFASAFDEFWVLPGGDFALTGLMSETYFLAEIFERVGVEPQLDHREEYKSAKNRYTEKAMTPAQREMTESILASLQEQMVREISGRSKKSSDEILEAINEGPWLAGVAKDKGLIDRLGYRDELYEKVKEGIAKEKTPLLYLARYAEKTRQKAKGKKVALIYGTGPIMSGPSKPSIPSGEMTFGALDVARAFRAAMDEEDIEGILFRVDSPGGSALASEVVWNEVRRAKAKGKKVVVSMGNVAGSGGYYVAAPADRILASPGTLTGSIGVVGGKIVLRKLWEKVGLKWDDAVTSPNARLYSTRFPFEGRGAEYSKLHMDQIYHDFMSKVAEGRSKTKEEIREVAKGRVWTGEQALECGLVDELGGLYESIEAMKKLLEVPKGKRIQLVDYPKSKGLMNRYLNNHPENSERAAASGVESWVPSLGVLGERTLMLAPDIELKI